MKTYDDDGCRDTWGWEGVEPARMDLRLTAGKNGASVRAERKKKIDSYGQTAPGSYTGVRTALALISTTLDGR